MLRPLVYLSRFLNFSPSYELLKYSTPFLDQTIANILNSTFTNHEELGINSGVLIAIQNQANPKDHQII